MAKTFKRTPAGIAEWPHLHAPDTKFDTDYGVYRIKVRFENQAVVQDILDAARKLIAEEMEAEKARRAEAKKKDPKKTFKPLKEADSPIVINEDTGEVTISFKAKAGGISKKDQKPWTRKIAVFDSAMQPLPEGTRVGGGSTVKVAYDMQAFATAIGVGVSMRLEAVQVLKLVEFGQASAGYFGFENEEPEDDTAEEATPGSDIEGAGQTESDF